MSFIKVAELNEIQEGELFSATIDGEPVCVTKIDNTFYAFNDNCTHISGPLNECGLENNCIVTCSWHGAQFDARTGKVLRGPARQDLSMYPVKVAEDGIYIDMAFEEA